MPVELETFYEQSAMRTLDELPVGTHLRLLGHERNPSSKKIEAHASIPHFKFHSGTGKRVTGCAAVTEQNDT